MGEMLDYYSVATIAFVGGSLVDTGCQNVLEPAAMGIPILVGPSQYNFATICKQLEHAGGLKTIQNEMELAQSVSTLIADERARQEMGERGKQLVRENQNALPALMKLVVPLASKL
jgi:3-deoxy-D-manno-octulosonic-acid transferase